MITHCKSINYSEKPIPFKFLYDGHGSVRALSDSNGSLTDSFTYDSYGLLIERTGNTPNNYLYAGEQYDHDLGLYYNRARYLDVNRGRFWSQDSFEGFDGEPLSLHKYLYGNGDPVNRIDPSGNLTSIVELAITEVIALIIIVAAVYQASPAYDTQLRQLNLAKVLQEAEKECGKDSLLGEGGIILYRSMKVDSDFLPVVEQTARGLGVRSPDDIVADNEGNVHPNTGGMSVSPFTPLNLPPFRRPSFLPGGSGKDSLFCINSNIIDATPGLQFRQDSQTHGLVEPDKKMSLPLYRGHLVQTRTFWRLLDPPKLQ